MCFITKAALDRVSGHNRAKSGANPQREGSMDPDVAKALKSLQDQLKSVNKTTDMLTNVTNDHAKYIDEQTVAINDNAKYVSKIEQRVAALEKGKKP
jgi:uncharacterized protein YoxC